MSRQAFATTRTEWLDLPNGGRVEVKKRLNIEEQKALESAPLVSVHRPDETEHADGQVEEVGIDWGRHYMRKLHLYLVDWDELVDEEDRPVPFSHAAIDQLEPDVAEEVTARLNLFLDAEDAKRKLPPSTAPTAPFSGSTSSPRPEAN